MRQKRCVLVMAGGKTRYEYNSYCWKSFLYLQAGPVLALEKIANAYKPFGIPLYVAVNQDDEEPPLEAFKDFIFIRTPLSTSIVDTISGSIPYIDKYDEVILNPIQVLPSTQINENSIALSNKEFRKENWSAVEFDEKGRASFLFRDDQISSGRLSHAFTGRICCSLEHLKAAIRSCSSFERKDLGYVASHLHYSHGYAFHLEPWLDLTHDYLKVASRMDSISSRAFHKLHYDDDNKTITKTVDSDKGVDEISLYYANLPPGIRRYFPALISTSVERKSYTFEYIPSPTLTELFLHENIGYLAWEKIIAQLKNVFDSIYSDPLPNCETGLAEILSQRLRLRAKAFDNWIQSDLFLDSNIPDLACQEEFCVNGISMPSIKNTFENLPSLLGSCAARSYYYGHGDLCFNNILVDPYSFIIKLIDPRLSASHPGGIGAVAPEYDIAKLNHSFIGLYDSVVNNMYHIDLCSRSKCVNLQLFTPPRYEYIAKVFNDVFQEHISAETRMLTAYLFFSMLPLHLENPRRVLALACIGNVLLYTNCAPSQIFK